MAVSRDDVLRTATLARLRVEPDRVDAVAAELSSILAHMEVLQQVDVSAVEPFADVSMPLREDVVAPVTLAKTREDNAPIMREGFFLVPRLVTHGDNRADSE
jgi:aspartyl-tRNA(Asn)/glutamyl-tRNA(Gln) amidotransferase subunit C